ncbi:MAG: phage tail protein, partial [Alphaproteobacteria bacterium HGW-Alphaproteobacteria-2]
MDELRGDVDALDEDLRALEATLGRAGDVTGEFLGEMEGFRRTLLFTGREVEGLSRSIGFGLRRAVDGLVFDGARLSDVLRGLGASVSRAAFNTAFRPVQDAFGSAVTGGANALFSGIFG